MILSNSYSSSYFLTRDTKNSHVMSPCSAPGSVCGLIQGSELHPSVHSFIIIIIIQRTLRFTIVYTWSFSMCMYMCACVLLFFSGSLEFKLHKTFSMHLKNRLLWSSGSIQSLSHVQLCDPMDCSRPGFPVLHQLRELAQTHVHRGSDAIQSSHPLSSPSPPTFNLSQHQGLFQWVSSSHQVVKMLEFQLQHQSFQWIFRTDFL